MTAIVIGVSLFGQVEPEETQDYLGLGYEKLAQNQPQEALQLFEKVENNQEELLVGHCVAAFMMNSWNEALNLCQYLPDPYNQLDGLQGIIIESLINLGRISEAEQKIQELLRKPPEKGDVFYPTYFQEFKDKKLVQWNRYYVIGLFYKNVKGEPLTALDFLNRIENPRPEVIIEKARLFIDLRRNDEAKALIEPLLTRTQEKNQKAQLLYLMGLIYEKMHLNADAFRFYEQYFSQALVNDIHRTSFANVLMELRRYDLALDQYQTLKSEYELSPQDTLNYIKCLVHTNQFEVANETAWKWVSENDVPLVNQIQLAQLMLITRNQQLLERILRDVRQTQRTTEENQALIRLWTDLANYQEATSLASFEQKKLLNTSEGALVLAELHLKLSNLQKAQEYAQRAAELAPSDIHVAQLFSKYPRGLGEIAKGVKKQRERLERDPDSVSLQLELARDLIELGIESYSTGEMKRVQDSIDLREAHKILEKIAQQTHDLPEVYFLLGKIHYLFDQSSEAEIAYNKALELDPSYVEAYQYRALIYEDSNELQKARESILKAIQFTPSNPSVWLQYADISMKNGDTNEAIKSLTYAIKQSPNDPEPYIQLAQIHLKMKNPESAVIQLEKALNLSPRHLEGVKLMITALYDPLYERGELDEERLERKRQQLFDRLEALDPRAAQVMREKFIR